MLNNTTVNSFVKFRWKSGRNRLFGNCWGFT